MDKNRLKEIIEYERKRWLQLNGLDAGSKVKNRELNFVESLRYVEYYQSFPKWKRLFVGGAPYVYHRLSYNRLCSENNVWIMPNCFGKGLVIRHLQHIMTSADKKVGEDCTILHNVTIGVAFKKDGDGAPVIGNDVLICSGAGIYGNITIADHCTVAANAVEIKSCETQGKVLMGIPAKQHDGENVRH